MSAFSTLDEIYVETYNCFNETLFIDGEGLMNCTSTKKEPNEYLTEVYLKMNEEGRKILDVVMQKLVEIQWRSGRKMKGKIDVEHEKKI